MSAQQKQQKQPKQQKQKTKQKPKRKASQNSDLPIVQHIQLNYSDEEKDSFLNTMHCAYGQVSLQYFCLDHKSLENESLSQGLTQLDFECFFDPESNQLITSPELGRQYLPIVVQSKIPFAYGVMCVDKKNNPYRQFCPVYDDFPKVLVPKSTLSDFKSWTHDCIITPANKALVDACISIAQQYQDPFLAVVHNDKLEIKIKKHKTLQYAFAIVSPKDSLCPIIQFSHLEKGTAPNLYEILDNNELVKLAQYIVTPKNTAYKKYPKTAQFCCLHAYCKLLEQLTPCFSKIYSMIEELVEKEKSKLFELYDKNSPEFHKLIAKKEQEIQKLVLSQLDSNVDDIETKDLLTIVNLFHAIFQYESIHKEYCALLNYGDKQVILDKLTDIRKTQAELFNNLVEACKAKLKVDTDFAKGEVKFFLNDHKLFNTGMQDNACFIPLDNKFCREAMQDLLNYIDSNYSFVHKSSLDLTLEYLSFKNTLKANGFTDKEVLDLLVEMHTSIFMLGITQQAQQLFQKTGSIALLNNVMKSMALKKVSKDFDFQSFMEKKLRAKVEQKIARKQEEYKALKP